MAIAEFIPYFKILIKDWRVIFITVAMILYIALAVYVVNYRKKPPKIKKEKKAAPAPAAAPAAGGDAEKAEGEAASAEKPAEAPAK